MISLFNLKLITVYIDLSILIYNTNIFFALFGLQPQLQQIVDKTILFADKDGDGKISFEEFADVWFFL